MKDFFTVLFVLLDQMYFNLNLRLKTKYINLYYCIIKCENKFDGIFIFLVCLTSNWICFYTERGVKIQRKILGAKFEIWIAGWISYFFCPVAKTRNISHTFTQNKIEYSRFHFSFLLLVVDSIFHQKWIL